MEKIAKKGGYPIEIFKDKDNLEKLKCKICLDVIRDSFSCNCLENHSFCNYCITNKLEFKNTCPVGNDALNKSDLKKNKTMDDEIEGKICFCRQNNHGCNWEGKPSSWNKHDEIECNYQLVSCKFCFKLIKKLEKDGHEKSCVENPQAKAKTPVISQEKGEELKVCEFSQFGCNEMVKNTEQSSHVTTEFHISILLNEIKAWRKENEILKSKIDKIESMVLKETWCEICKMNAWFFCGQCGFKKCIFCQTKNIICCKIKICDDCRKCCHFCLRKCCKECLKVCSQCKNDICLLCENYCKQADLYPNRKEFLPVIYSIQNSSNIFRAFQITSNTYKKVNLESYKFENEEIKSQIIAKPIFTKDCSICVVYDTFYISGGTVENTAVKDFWEICPRESTVKKKSDIPIATFNHKTHWIPPNQIIAVGGRKLEYEFCEATQIYNLTSNEWEILPNLNIPRINCTVGIWNDHIIIALGGTPKNLPLSSLNVIEMLDINQKAKGWICLEIKEMGDWNKYFQSVFICAVQINSLVFGALNNKNVHSFNQQNSSFSKKCEQAFQIYDLHGTYFFYKNAIYKMDSQNVVIYDVEKNLVSSKETEEDDEDLEIIV